MKSKNPKIQTILKKGIVVLMSAMLTLTPIVQATSSLDDNYLDSSWLDKLLYGSVGSTAKEIEEYFKSHTTLYITNETQLRALAEYVNNGNNCLNKEIILLNDIEIDSSVEWIPIGTKYSNSFYGTFDGNGFSISGLKYLKEGKTQEELIHVGLFGISYGNIKNVTINNFNIDLLWDEEDLKFDEDYNKGMVTTIQVATGNLVASNYGTIENCINNSNIRGGRIVGGLVASNSGSVINCKNTGDIDGFYEVGGIVGEIPRLENGGTHSLGKVENCTNEGNVHAAYIEAGGIIGSVSSRGEISKCKNIGKVFVSKDAPSEHIVKVLGTDTQMLHARVGGIVGYSEDSDVNNCINEGEIYGYNYVGGIVGYTPTHSNVNRVNTIESVINKGKISGDNNIGGIVGRANNTNISNVANQQIVNGNDVTGGIAGKIDNTKIINSANTLNSHQDHNLNITGNNYVGGIVGSIVNSVGNSELKYNINKSAIRGNYAIGGIAGYVEGTNTTIENCYNEDSITYDENDFTTHDIIAVRTAGGIVGDASNTTIKNSINVAEVCIIESAAGGIAGALKNSTVNNCAVQQGIKVDITNWKHSFTEGYKYSIYKNKANPVIEDRNYERIYTPGYIGSIVGNIAQGNDEKTEIKKCFVGTSVIGGAYVGGVVGRIGAGGTVVVDEISRGERFKGVGAYAYDIDGTRYGNYVEFGKQVPENLKEQAGINNIGVMYGYNINKNENTKLDTDFTGEPVTYEDYIFAGVKLCISNNTGDNYYQIDETPEFMMGSSYLRLNVSGNDVLMGCDMSSEEIGIISSDSTIIAKDSKGTEATFTISGGTVKNNVRYFKAGDKITVNASFNKYLVTSYGPLTSISEDKAPILKLNNSIVMEASNITASNYKSTVTYTYTVGSNESFEIKNINIIRPTNKVYAVGTDYATVHPELENMTASVSNVKIDAVAPKVNTNIYVENELETERYTTGKDIIIEVTTDERIDGDYNRPEIKVEFSESGEGKYNYSKEENTVGFAKCVDAKLNIDGTTTWKYIYQIQEGDEGEFEFNFASGTIKDVAGNTSNIATLYTPQNSSFGTQASNWNSNVGISYKLYKNSVSNTNEVNAETYFANGDDLVVVTTFDKVLYSYYTKINDTEHKKAIDKNAAPSLYLPNGTKVNASSVSNSQNTVITYKFEDISNNYQTLTNLKALKLVNENNKVAISLSGSNVTTTTTTEAQPIIFKLDNSNANIAKNAIKVINIENVIIDNQGVSEQLESNIYADTTAPTVTITTDTTNPTNANLITYTIEASEKVVGCEETDIIVNNGTIKEVIVVEEGRKYTVKVETVPVSNGNQEEVKLILEEGICKDLVGRDNIRVEHVTIIDKKAPEVTITSDKDYVKANEDITYTFTWSEEVVEFTKENITVNNGTKGTFAGEGNKYTLVVKPTGENDVEVVVAEGVVTDVAGNNNIASAKNIIPVIPTVVITTNTSNPTNESEITYTFTWNETVVGFDISDILLPNGVTGTLTEGQNNIYTMVINYNSLIPAGNEGEVTVAVKEKAVTDINGNENAYTANTLKIDRIAPIFIGLESYVVSDISLDSNVDTVKQYYKAGDIVTIIATFTENIESSNVPTLNLQFSESGNAKAEISAGVKSGNKITYTYTITNGDVGTLSVKGFAGEVKDAAGNTTKVTKRILDGDTIIADTRVPNLKELKVVNPSTGVYKAGETIKIEAIYDEEIYALENNVIKLITSDSAPVLKLKFGNGAERTATAVGYGITDGKEDRTKIEYKYTIVDGDNGILKLTSYTGKTVCDIAGNVVTLGVNQTGNEITADTIRPRVTNIVAKVEDSLVKGINGDPSNTQTGYYKAGNEVKITLTFSEPVSGAVIMPEILVGFSENLDSEPTKYNTYAYESDWNVNSTTIEYSYTIKDGDNGYLWIKVPENQFADEAGNGNVEKSATKLVNIFADTTKPTVTLTRDIEVEQNNQTIIIKAEFSENVYDLKGDTRVALTKENAPKLIYSFGTGENKEASASNVNGAIITYTIKKDPVNDDGTLRYELAKGNLCDRAGNLYYEETTDTTAPVLESVVISTNAGKYNPYCKVGTEIYVTATFNEPIAAENINLKAKVGEKEISQLNGSIVKECPEQVKFTYTVKAGDMGAFQILDVCGNTDNAITEENADKTYGWVRDAKGNQNNIYSFADEGVTVSGRAEADTKDPYITNIKVNSNGKEIATYTKEEGKDAVITVGRTNGNIVEYIVTYSEKVPYSHFEKISITNGIIRDIEYTNSSLNQYKVTVQTTVEGVQSLIINEGTVEDKAGNIDGFVRFDAVTTDFTKPTVRFISEYNGGVYVLPTNIGKVEIRPNVEISEDIAKIEYKWDNGEYTEIENYSSSSDIAIPTKSFTEAGQYRLFIKVEDLAGNVYETSKTYIVRNSYIDIESNNTDYTNQDLTITVSFEEGLTDNRKVMFRAEGSNETVEMNASGTNEKGTEYIISTNGVIYAEATDRVGNKVFTDYTIGNIDKEDPEIIIELNGANLVIGTGEDVATIRTNVETSDNNWIEDAKYAFLQENLDVDNITSEQKEKISNKLNYEAKLENAKSGTYYLYVLAEDPAGNETIVKSEPFIVLDTNERKTTETVEGENGPVEQEKVIPAEKPVNELIKFEQVQEDVKDRAYVNVDYDYSIIKDLYITLADETYGFVDEYNSVELYGNTTIKVEAWDACGNRVYNEYRVTDIEGPEFAIFDNPEDWTKNDVTLEIYSNSELKSVTINDKNIALNNNRNSATEKITQYGNYTVKVTDIYNNTSEKTVEVKIDKSAPVITDVEVENGEIIITANDIDETLDRELSGIVGYAITNTNEVPVEWTESNIIKTTVDGTFFVWVKDNVGHITMKEESVTRDIVAPEVTITANPELGNWVNTDINIVVEANEELNSLEVTYNGEAIEGTINGETIEGTVFDAKTYGYEIESSGTYTIIAIDKSGNKTVETIEAKIDKSMPEISEAKSDGKTITITATDDSSGIAGYAITNTTEVPVEWSKSNAIKVTEDGIFYVWVKDNAGNIRVDDEAVVVDTTVPTITFNYTSITVEAGLPIQLSINTDEEAKISYSWDEETWVDSEELLTSVKVSKEYKTIGVYTLYAKAEDKFGNKTKVQTIEFSVVKPEEIEIAQIIFNDLPTIQVDGVHYVKVAADMTIEDITNKMDKDALCGVVPEYKNLTEENELKTGSEITLDSDTKYIVVVNGDVNCDGKVAPIDVTLANRIRLNKVSSSTIQRLAADFDLDGIVKAIDITMINRYRLGKIKGI